MATVSDLRSQLIRDEGLRLRPYSDTHGKLTIGVGRNLTDRGITMAEAEVLLDNDLREALTLSERLPWVLDLDDARRGVLYNMAFNLGVSGLLGFTRTLEFIKTGRYAEGAAEMLKSEWAAQVGDRAERLSLQMESGVWV